MKTKYLIKIAYDGLKFHGTQIQPDKRTVQGELEEHLSFLYNEPIKVTGGSRTDTLVHALE
jgi:tRNA pseudouridine38-40 synthase